jgi:catalase-peroxidase
VTVPFAPGRMDASEEWTDAHSFEALRPVADGFRNYYHDSNFMAPEEALVDKAQLLRLSAPEMTVLVGGLRVLGANAFDSQDGVFTDRVGTLSNDFFVNLLDMKTEWVATEHKNRFQGLDRKTKEARHTASRVDLIFGSNSELRAQAEAYAQAGSNARFVRDFVKAWTKVMNADRLDLQKPAVAFSQQLSA